VGETRGAYLVGVRARTVGLLLGGVATVSAMAVAVAALRSGEACAAVARDAPAPGVAYSGQATNYEARGGGGNCSYPAPPADQLYVALSSGEYSAAGACGGYLDVTGPKGSVRVKVIDQCPECRTGHLDLSRTAFARIATLSDGLVKVRYRLVRDPAVPSGLTYRVQEGSSRYWLSLLPDHHGDPVARLEVRSGGGAWMALRHADYNYWIAEQGAGPGPFTVRLTDIYGGRVVSGPVALRPGVTQRPGGATAPGAGPPSRRPASPAPSPSRTKKATPSTPSRAPSPTPSSGQPPATALPPATTPPPATCA
jgi:expansin